MATLSESSDSNLTTAQISQRLIAHLHALSRPRDPFLGAGNHRLAQSYIRTALAKWGQVTHQNYTSLNREHCNWQIVLEGQQPKRSPILVGAHYDTVPGSPGADDNASGIATLLTLAELLYTQPARRSIHLIAFDLEEYGLVGSTACAQRWQEQGQPLHLMLSLEMLGYFSEEPHSQQYPIKLLHRIYPDKGNFIALVGNEKTLFKMMRLQRSLKQAGAPCWWLPVINQGKLIPATRRSDHAPFWDAGYPAVMMTDTADLRNPHYHGPTDRLETLSIEMMSCITMGLANYLRQA
ncbi:MAG: M28 family peptidase [Cyanobacteria bacterium J06632_3]